ncbi:hypothetical protein TNCV_5131341 [Trichonephila clavipes]|nr:hypothetical protein TNCV_5131341 [Trichonephila clavipes]
MPRVPKSLKTALVGCLTQEDDQLLNDRFTYKTLKTMGETKKGKSASPEDLWAELFLSLGNKSKLTMCYTSIIHSVAKKYMHPEEIKLQSRNSARM